MANLKKIDQGTRPAPHLVSILFFFLKKMGQPQPLFCLNLSFQTNITILTTKKCKKCQSSIQCQDSNSQPSDYESPPLTTRPGLPPFIIFILALWSVPV